MTTYSPVAITVDGVAAEYNNAAAGDKVAGAGPNTFITVKNGSASAVTLTITPAGKTSYGVALPAKIWTIDASGEMDVPILPDYGNASDSGLVALTWSSTTTVTFAVKRI